MLRSFASCLLLLLAGFASFLVLPVRPLSPRIVGGTVTDIRQHPYQLSLQQLSTSFWCIKEHCWRHICGATIMSNKWAITAAHCVNSNVPVSVYAVSAGNNDKYEGTYYKIKKIIQHPSFNSLTMDYDIALLEIDGEIAFNDRVQPAKLAANEPPVGTMLNVTGWGVIRKKFDSSPESPVLKKVTVPIVDRSKCRRAYRYFFSITDRMICAGYKAGGKDACQGDSGGPLASNDTLYGIVSWGFGCARPNYPGVYTNIADVLWWIKWISAV